MGQKRRAAVAAAAVAAAAGLKAGTVAPAAAADERRGAAAAPGQRLVGRWYRSVTCREIAAALRRPGLADQTALVAQALKFDDGLHADGVDACATAGSLRFGRRFTRTSLVWYGPDGRPGWNGSYRVVDGRTFVAGDRAYGTDATTSPTATGSRGPASSWTSSTTGSCCR